MSKVEKQKDEPNKYDLIRDILRNHSSREKPISRKSIEECARKREYSLGRTAVEGFMRDIDVVDYETDDECDFILGNWEPEKREIILCKKGKNGRTIGYWMQESISDSEWMFLLDSVLYSKVLTKKEADNLAKRITLLAGKNFSDLTKYRHRMEDQPYFVGDEKIDKSRGHIESQVLRQVRLIREAMNMNPPRKVKFDLNVYKYGNQRVQLVPYGKFGRICSPYDIIYSNGRYYMLGADLETEKVKI